MHSFIRGALLTSLLVGTVGCAPDDRTPTSGSAAESAPPGTSQQPDDREPTSGSRDESAPPATAHQWPASAALSPGEHRYRITNGNGYTVCEAFLRNLNAFPPDEPPMVCDQKIHPSHPEFSRPQWEEMDVQSNLQLIYEAESLIWRFTPIGTERKPFGEWEQRYQERIRAGEAKPRLRRTVLDLNGNGPEILIWYEAVPSTCHDDWTQHKYVGGGNQTGGYMFVQRTKSGPMEMLHGVAQSRSDVILDRSRRPYFVELSANVFDQLEIGLRPVSPGMTERNEYVAVQRCEFTADVAVEQN